MKKIPIKFRGIDWETGEYVYGDLIQGNYDEVCPRIKPRKKKARYVKDVAQLVGYDVDGKEVYEGDTLTDILGNEYTARIRIELICDDAQSCTGKAYYAGTIDNLKLKEKTA